jgi:hypothetical protein
MHSQCGGGIPRSLVSRGDVKEKPLPMLLQPVAIVDRRRDARDDSLEFPAVIQR